MTRHLLDASRAACRPYATEETMFLWTGTFRGDHGFVRTLRTPPVARSAGRVIIAREDMRAVGRNLRAAGELLVMQVHTHPCEVAFSDVDRREAADQGAGALAMVVHQYGQTDWGPDRDVAVYERNQDGDWHRWRGRLEVRG